MELRIVVVEHEIQMSEVRWEMDRMGRVRFVRMVYLLLVVAVVDVSCDYDVY